MVDQVKTPIVNKCLIFWCIYTDSLYYDENLKRWVDPNADPNEDDGHNTKPPPTDMQLMGGMNSNKPILNNSNSLSDMSNGPPPPSGGNKYSAGEWLHKR